MKFRLWLALAVFLFTAGLVWGLTLSINDPGPLDQDLNSLKSMADFISVLPQSSMFLFIFLKNAAALAAGFILSPVLCLVPIATLVVNGGILGLYRTRWRIKSHSAFSWLGCCRTV